MKYIKIIQTPTAKLNHNERVILGLIHTLLSSKKCDKIYKNALYIKIAEYSSISKKTIQRTLKQLESKDAIVIDSNKIKLNNNIYNSLRGNSPLISVPVNLLKKYDIKKAVSISCILRVEEIASYKNKRTEIVFSRITSLATMAGVTRRYMSNLLKELSELNLIHLNVNNHKGIAFTVNAKLRDMLEDTAEEITEDMAEVIELSQYSFIITDEDLNMFAAAKQPATAYNDVSIDLDLL